MQLSSRPDLSCTMSEASQLAEDIVHLTLHEQSSLPALNGLRIGSPEPADASQAMDFELGVQMAVENMRTVTATSSESEDAKNAAYDAALQNIHAVKTNNKVKKRKRSQQRRPEAAYKKARQRKADGSEPKSRYRHTVREKIEILRFWKGDGLNPGHTRRETMEKFANVTKSQLKQWKKKCVF